jgi:D-3-phosphoglycerate dehydrogenase
MHISMIEPLNVPKDVISKLSQSLINKGHTFKACHKPLSKTEKLAQAKGADVLIITNGQLDENIIKENPQLKMISVGFTGIDHVPANLIKDQGITVSNSQGYATIPTAELAVTHMLVATRYLKQTEALCRQGKTKEDFVGFELSHKTVGIVGTGQIGKQVASLLKGFNVKLLGYDPYPNDEAKQLGIEYVSLQELFKASDFITLHLPLLDSTKGLIDASLIGSMKQDAVLVNCARGPIVDQNALINALNSSKIRAAGIDVYDIEPPLAVDHPYFSANNLSTTPHIAFASKESMVRRAKIVFDNVEAFIDGNPINVKL